MKKAAHLLSLLLRQVTTKHQRSFRQIQILLQSLRNFLKIMCGGINATDTDLWYRTERIPNDARFTYAFQVNRPVKMPRSGDLAGFAKVMEHCPSWPDPLNPRDVAVGAG